MSEKRKSRRAAPVGLTALILMLAFAACAVAAVLQAAVAYRNVSSALDTEYGLHTCLNYIQSRLRAVPDAYPSDFEGRSALYCPEDGGYVTIIYCYDGALYELYCSEEYPLSPADGEELLEIEALTFTPMENNLMRVECSASGAEGEIVLRAGAEGGAAS